MLAKEKAFPHSLHAYDLVPPSGLRVASKDADGASRGRRLGNQVHCRR